MKNVLIMTAYLKPTCIQLALWVALIASTVLGVWQGNYLLAACALTSAISSLFFTWLYQRKATQIQSTARGSDAAVKIEISDTHGQTWTGFQSACRDVPTLLREQFGQLKTYEELQQTVRIEITSGPYKGVYGNAVDAMVWPEWLIQGHCQ